MWSPITLAELEVWIARGESKLDKELMDFWLQIKIKPEKWEEKEFGTEGGGFWVVAVARNKVVYFNDIEEGFNVSEYDTYGIIKDYWCQQDELNWAIMSLFNQI